MTQSIARKAGKAIIWKGIQLGTGQTVNLIRILILARLLVPEDFGLMSIALVTVNTIHSITDFGMTSALVQRSDVEEGHYHLAWTLVFFRGLFITLAILIGAPLIADLFSEPQVLPILRALAFRPLIDAVASIKVADLTRQLRFRSLTFISTPTILVETVVSISLARTFGVWALVGGTLTGAFIGVVMSYIFAPYFPRLRFDHERARPLIRYGRWIFLTGVVAIAGSSLLQVFISRQLGTASLGLYYLALRLAFLPHEISAKIIGEVSFPIFAQFQSDTQKSSYAFHTIYTGMMATLLPLYTLFIAFAPTLVDDVLGQGWMGTIPLIRILALAGLFGLFGDAVIPLLKGTGQPYKVAALEAVQSILIIVLVRWLAANYGLVGATFAWLPAIASSQVLAGIFLVRILDHPFAGLARPILSIAVASAAGALIGLAADAFLFGLFGFVLSASLSLMTVVFVLWLLDRFLSLGMAQTFFTAFPQIAVMKRYLPVGQSRV